MPTSSPVGESPAERGLTSLAGRSKLGLAWVYQQRIGRLGTVSADGEPHCVPVIYGYDVRGDCLWFMSRASTRKVANLLATERAALSVDDPQAVRGVTLVGPTTIIEAGERHENVVAWLRERGLLSPDRDMTGQVAVRFEASRWSEWGLTPAGRAATQS